MKRIYITPSILVVTLRGGKICDSLLVGSVGAGEDYVKREFSNDEAPTASSRRNYNVWDDDWSN